MHILLIAYEFPPSPSPQSLRWAYLCGHLARQGHRVSVLTIHLGGESAGLPSLPASVAVHRTFAGPIRGALAALRDRRQRRAGGDGDGEATATTPDTPQAPRSGQGWKQRLSDLLQNAAAKVVFPDVRGEWSPWARRRLKTLLDTDPPDLVISSHEPATSLELGLLAKHRGWPWIADLGDPVLAPYTPARWRKRAMRLERTVCETADHILVTTPAAARLLQERHGRRDRVAVVTQGHAGEGSVQALGAADNPECLELLYTGSFYSFRRPDALLEALRGLAGVRLNIAAITLPPSVLAFAREFPGKVKLLGFLPHRHAIELQRGADLLVNIGNADPSQVPGKIYEYLGACRPILHLGEDSDAIARLLAELRRGWSLENRSDAIASGLEALRDAKWRGGLGRELDLSTAAVSEWDWKQLAARIDGIARMLVSAR